MTGTQTTPITDQPEHRYVLTLGCPDRLGIVARISSFLTEVGGWITEVAYHSDADTGWFFTRQAIRTDSVPYTADELRERFATEVADWLGPETEWKLTDSREKPSCCWSARRLTASSTCWGVRIAVSCRPPSTPSSATTPNSNNSATRFGIPFHHVPFARDRKSEAFAELARVVDGYDPDAVVLARFMRILPPKLCEAWAGRVINIHHSFLPSFVGARPYHQAFARGVKLIGATCHYVTADLDAGPIIEQDVIRIDHSDSVTDMVRQGRDIETLVLARGLGLALEDRILVHGRRTVIFNSANTGGARSPRMVTGPRPLRRARRISPATDRMSQLKAFS